MIQKGRFCLTITNTSRVRPWRRRHLPLGPYSRHRTPAWWWLGGQPAALCHAELFRASWLTGGGVSSVVPGFWRSLISCSKEPKNDGRVGWRASVSYMPDFCFAFALQRKVRGSPSMRKLEERGLRCPEGRNG